MHKSTSYGSGAAFNHIPATFRFLLTLVLVGLSMFFHPVLPASKYMLADIYDVVEAHLFPLPFEAAKRDFSPRTLLCRGRSRAGSVDHDLRQRCLPDRGSFVR